MSIKKKKKKEPLRCCEISCKSKNVTQKFIAIPDGVEFEIKEGKETRYLCGKHGHILVSLVNKFNRQFESPSSEIEQQLSQSSQSQDLVLQSTPKRSHFFFFLIDNFN